MKRERVILAVERGWQNTRQLSLGLDKKGYLVDVLIKGEVAPEVLAMITSHAGIRIKSIGRFWFRPRFFLKITTAALFGGLKAVGIEGKDTEGWIRFLGRALNLKVFLITDESSDYL
jgi:hypothetical protein